MQLIILFEMREEFLYRLQQVSLDDTLRHPLTGCEVEHGKMTDWLSVLDDLISEKTASEAATAGTVQPREQRLTDTDILQYALAIVNPSSKEARRHV